MYTADEIRKLTERSSPHTRMMSVLYKAIMDAAIGNALAGPTYQTIAYLPKSEVSIVMLQDALNFLRRDGYDVEALWDRPDEYGIRISWKKDNGQ